MGKVQLVDNWNQAHKMLSIWFFAAVGLAPEIYNLAIQMNVFTADEAPAALSRLINGLAFAGAVARLVKQNVAAQVAEAETEQK